MYSFFFLRFFEIVFVRDVGMCVFTPEAINYIHVIFNLYNQMNKFAVFRNVMKLSIHGRGLCNEAHHDKNQGYVSDVKVVSFTKKVVLMAVHE